MPKARNGKEGANPTGKGQRQPYHMTCSNCRKRKVKCDGGRPECGICRAYAEQCHYDRMPSMSQVMAMVDRIAELEKALTHDTGTTTAAPTVVSDEALSTTAGATPTNMAQSPWFSSTSAVHDPMPPMDRLPSKAPLPPASDNQSLSMSMEQLSFWEDAATNVCATLLSLTTSKIKHLLATHWCWVHPTFWFVTQSVFMRAAAAGGPNFSQLLLCVICLHSTRFTDHNLAEDLLARAQLLLGQDMHKPPSIPTLQALLLLSAREIGSGSISQAWLYSGMAFRMVIDIGIYSTPAKSTSAGEHQIRQRLAWSCFLWDKAMSLYLGRVPTLLNAPDFDPPCADSALDNTVWYPYPDTNSNSMDDSCSMSYTSSCFNNLCKLFVIINDILVTIYGHQRPSLVEASFVQRTKQELEKWREGSPDYLIIQNTDQNCPPPHIMTQNVLFHTAVILLHRPFRQNRACRQACQDAACDIEHILDIFEKSFGFAHATYLVAYCAYTAATVALQDLEDHTPGAQGRLNTYLRTLHGVRRSCPGIQRSIDMIIKHMDQPPVRSEDDDVSLPQPPQQTSHDSLPAFPFNTIDEFYEIPSGQPDTLRFGSLDLFAHEWSSISDDQLNTFLDASSTSLL